MAASLDPRPERRRRLAALRGWIDDFHRRRGDDDLVWITVPSLIVRSRHLYAERSAGRRVAPKRAQKLLEKHRLSFDSRWSLYGGHLFLVSTDNQRRAQLPVAARLGDERPDVGRVDPSDARVDELGARAIALAGELMDAAEHSRLKLHERRRVYLQFVTAGANLAWFEALIERVRPPTVVIGSTHSIPARALVLAARRAGVPSVYVPHAPVLTEARLADLPVDFAALRGPKEIDYYAEVGADRDGMEAVGNPAVEAPGDLPELRPDLQPVLAPHAIDDQTLRQVIDLVTAAVAEPVTISPHPRTDRDSVRAVLPPEWDMWDGRTFDLLRLGPPAVLLFSTGVALEAMQLGLPAIELSFPGEVPNYPFLRHPELRSVSTPDELRLAVEAASGITGAQRESLRDWARGWVCAEGDTAAESGAALIRRAASQGPRAAWIWDAWGRR